MSSGMFILKWLTPQITDGKKHSNEGAALFWRPGAFTLLGNY